MMMDSRTQQREFGIQRERGFSYTQRCLLFKYEAAVFSKERCKSLGDLGIRNTVFHLFLLSHVANMAEKGIARGFRSFSIDNY